MVTQRGKLVLTIRKDSIPTVADWAFIFFFSGIALHFLIIRVARVIGLSSYSGLLVLLFHATTALFVAIGFINAGKKKQTDTIVLYSVIVLVFLFSYILNPDIGVWLTDESYGILSSVIELEGGVFGGGIIGYVVIRIQKNPESIFKNLKICNIFWIVYLLFIAINRLRLGYFEITDVNGELIQSSYHMSFGYYCTFISLLNFCLWKREKKWLYIVVGTVFLLLSIAFGARGVIIVYAVYIVSILWVALHEIATVKKLVISFVIALLAFFIVTYFTEILYGIQHLLRTLGVADSRTITSLITGEITEANGRDQIWTMAIEMIKDKFPLGYGAYGDRPVIGQQFGWGYCHNIFLEIIIAFGLIGVIVCLYLIVRAAMIVNNTKNKDWNLLFIMFLSNCGMLLISNSFWYDSYFWATIAVGVAYTQDVKNSKTNRLVVTEHRG